MEAGVPRQFNSVKELLIAGRAFIASHKRLGKGSFYVSVYTIQSLRASDSSYPVELGYCAIGSLAAAEIGTDAVRIGAWKPSPILRQAWAALDKYAEQEQPGFNIV